MSPFDLQVYGSFQTIKKKSLFMFKPIVAERKSVIEESKKSNFSPYWGALIKRKTISLQGSLWFLYKGFYAIKTNIHNV